MEKDTRGQFRSNKWFSFRAGRCTASNAKAICRTSLTQPSISLVRKVCYPLDQRFHSDATDWGLNNEEVARNCYIAAIAHYHEDFTCSKSGLQISLEHPFLAATPDGLVKCSCCGEGVVEIKCPYNQRDQTIDQMVSRSDVCLEKTNEGTRLKRESTYFFQVQMQMLVCKCKFCDFVLWTKGRPSSSGFLWMKLSAKI